MSERGLGTLRGRLELRLDFVANLGLSASALYALQKFRLRRFPPSAPHVWLSSKRAKFPLRCRPGTSDLDVFVQIFIQREYRCLDDVAEARFIVDCGANVGYSSAYLLTRYPTARLVAVEPDRGNFAMLEANLAPYGARARAIQTGVWSHSTGLVPDEAPFRDGREWSRTFREVRPGETPAMAATDIATILASSGEPRISILKIDVEGAERVVFAENTAAWLPKVDNLVIELHDAEAESIFDCAIAPEGFEVSTCGELRVCKRHAHS
jgi:FkbM family methyltransferase